MKSSSLQLIHDARRWDEFASAHDGHILQSYAWGELKARFGWRAERWAWAEGATIRAGAQVLYRQLAPRLRVAYVPRGPIAADAEFLTALRELVKTRGAFLLKLEPNLLRDDPRNAALSASGFQPSPETIQPPATIRVDLTRPPAALLAAMKPKWRYNIRLAEKKGVVVRAGTPADLDAFHQLARITAARDRFAIHSAAYYRAAFELLTARESARLFVAEYKGKALAMIFVAACAREAIYLYGASGDEQRNVMPNHALHWAALQWAQARGCAWYDLWGIPEKVPRRGGGSLPVGADAGEATSPLPDSLYQFKRGFGGEVAHYSGAWNFVYAPIPHLLYRLARALRRSGAG